MPIPDLSIKIIRYLADKYPKTEKYIYKEFGVYIKKTFSVLNEPKANIKQEDVVDIIKEIEDDYIEYLFLQNEISEYLEFRSFKKELQSEILALICHEIFG